MNLFNYLMARKGHNTSPRDDLFAYLLGKIPKVVKEVTGVTIHITDVSKKKIISLWLNKESTQDGTPTSSNPVPVEVVKGYIKDGNNYVDVIVEDGNGNSNVVSIPLNGNFIAGIGDYKDTLMVDKSGKCYLNKRIIKLLFNGQENWSTRKIRENTQTLYEIGVSQYNLYSTSRVALGLCNKYIKSIEFTNNNTFRVMSGNTLGIRNDTIGSLADFKNDLDNKNLIVYYPLAQEELIDLNYTVDLKLFIGENNISNSEDMMMTLKYY